MHIAIIVSHPEPNSLSWAITHQVRDGLLSSGTHSFDIIDLVREKFDPSITAADLDFYRGNGDLDPVISAEQARIDRADALVFVFPVYWWSVPALLKGWIDRVFTNGWAYEYTEDGKARGRLKNRPTLLIGVAAGNQAGYTKHGYEEAIRAQITDGIFRFCGLTDVSVHLLFESENPGETIQQQHLETSFALGTALFD